MYSVNFITDYEGCMTNYEPNWIRMFYAWTDIIKSYGSDLPREKVFETVVDVDLKMGLSGITYFSSHFSLSELTRRICDRTGVRYSEKILEEFKEREGILAQPAELRYGFKKILPLIDPSSFYIVSDMPILWIENTVAYHDISVTDIVTPDDYGTNDKRILYTRVLKENGKNIILGNTLDTDILPGNELKKDYQTVTVYYPFSGQRLQWWNIITTRYEEITPDYEVNDETIFSVLQKELFEIR